MIASKSPWSGPRWSAGCPCSPCAGACRCSTSPSAAHTRPTLEPGSGDHHAAWDVAAHSLAHNASFAEGSLAASCYGATTAVNSLHHQAVKQLGDGMVATGWAADGMIEAAEVPGAPVLAVQWHPELVEGHPEPSFAWLVATASAASATQEPSSLGGVVASCNPSAESTSLLA